MGILIVSKDEDKDEEKKPVIGESSCPVLSLRPKRLLDARRTNEMMANSKIEAMRHLMERFGQNRTNRRLATYRKVSPVSAGG